MNYWVRFWLFMLSLIVALSTLAFLTLSFVFPGLEPLHVGQAGRLTITVVGVAAVGIVVWIGATFGAGTAEGPDRRDP